MENIKGFSDMKYTNRESDLLSVLHIFIQKMIYLSKRSIIFVILHINLI